MSCFLHKVGMKVIVTEPVDVVLPGGQRVRLTPGESGVVKLVKTKDHLIDVHLDRLDHLVTLQPSHIKQKP